MPRTKHYDYEIMWGIVGANPFSYNDGSVTAALVEEKLLYTDTGESARIYGAIVDEMWSHGFSEDDASKVLGGNLMRCYEQVWG